jgi:hypothetical protein
MEKVMTNDLSADEDVANDDDDVGSVNEWDIGVERSEQSKNYCLVSKNNEGGEEYGVSAYKECTEMDVFTNECITK